MERGDIVWDFMSLIGREDLFIADQAATKNERIPDHLIESLRLWNSVPKSNKIQRQIIKTFNSLIKRKLVPESVKIDFLSREGKKYLYDHSTKQNDYLRENFGCNEFFENLEDILDQSQYSMTDIEAYEAYNPLVMMDLTVKSLRSNLRSKPLRRKKRAKLTKYQKVKKSIARMRNRIKKVFSREDMTGIVDQTTTSQASEAKSDDNHGQGLEMEFQKGEDQSTTN
jgi:hypothetical protein